MATFFKHKINSIIKYCNILSLNVVLGCASCTFVFLEPNPFQYPKPLFTLMLSIAVWIIYTADHLIDGFKLKGKSGILRHDFHYKHRFIFIIAIIIISAFELVFAYSFREHIFIKNAIYIAMLMPVYFALKFLKFLNSIIKMLFVSAVFSIAVVMLYNSKNILIDFFSFEILAMILLAFLNQLVLEHFEFKNDEKNLKRYDAMYFSDIAHRVFIWLVFILTLISLLNFYSIPYTLSVFVAAFLIIKILKYPDFFNKNLYYRFWADFSLVLIFPLLKLFLWFQFFLTNLF